MASLGLNELKTLTATKSGRILQIWVRIIKSKLDGIPNRYEFVFIKENAYENGICKMTGMTGTVPRPQSLDRPQLSQSEDKKKIPPICLKYA